MLNKYKKIVLTIVGGLILLSCSACGKKEIETVRQEQTVESIEKAEENDGIKTEIGIHRDDLEFIYEREIFAFKYIDSELYTSTITDMETFDPYRNNWKMKDLLNEKYFRADTIKWSYERNDNSYKIVHFSGEAKSVEDDLKVDIVFVWNVGANMPMMLELTMTSSGKTVKMSANDYVDKGMTSEDAVICADATHSVMLTLGSCPIENISSSNNADVEKYIKTGVWVNPKVECYGDTTQIDNYMYQYIYISNEGIYLATSFDGYMAKWEIEDIREVGRNEYEVVYQHSKEYFPDQYFTEGETRTTVGRIRVEKGEILFYEKPTLLENKRFCYVGEDETNLETYVLNLQKSRENSEEDI